MSSVNLQLSKPDRIVKAAQASAQIQVQTPKVLEALLMTSNGLRQQAEKAAIGLEGVPRTKALEHILKD